MNYAMDSLLIIKEEKKLIMTKRYIKSGSVIIKLSENLLMNFLRH